MITAPVPRARPNGWYGMLALVATESALFASLLATYAYLRFHDPHWPPPGIDPPSITAPLVLALVLVAASAPMALAARTARQRTAGPLIAPVALALVVQAAYLAFQIHLYADDLGRFSASGSAYGSIYFTLLAVHHAHVGIGVLLDCWLIARLRGGLTGYRRTAVGAIALYWYFVSLAGLAVTATILTPAW
ncbi:MAG TPA: cytochrome c oxidase subunit 3 [Gaiellales bacterium]|jgi:heme/copper-type cytochrome/quinol oxidase subunit 3|nr:cytochrome c oxidase subunit 3 [Gaiellales bacterium]